MQGTPYHATGMVPCSVGTDAPGSAQCSFGVIRSGVGTAWDAMTADEREAFLDDVVHEDRLCSG